MTTRSSPWLRGLLPPVLLAIACAGLIAAPWLLKPYGLYILSLWINLQHLGILIGLLGLAQANVDQLIKVLIWCVVSHHCL